MRGDLGQLAPWNANQDDLAQAANDAACIEHGPFMAGTIENERDLPLKRRLKRDTLAAIGDAATGELRPSQRIRIDDGHAVTGNLEELRREKTDRAGSSDDDVIARPGLGRHEARERHAHEA